MEKRSDYITIIYLFSSFNSISSTFYRHLSSSLLYSILFCFFYCFLLFSIVFYCFLLFFISFHFISFYFILFCLISFRLSFFCIRLFFFFLLLFQTMTTVFENSLLNIFTFHSLFSLATFQILLFHHISIY